MWVVVFVLLMGYSFDASATQHPYYAKHPRHKELLDILLKQTRQLKPTRLRRFPLKMSVKDTNGKTFSFWTLKGKTILLTRWATWCKACKAELPGKLALQKSNTKLALVGVTNERAAVVRPFMNALKPGAFFPITLHDPANRLAQLLPTAYLPVTLIVDPWGWIVAKRVGPGMWHWKAHREAIQFLTQPAQMWRLRKKTYRQWLRAARGVAPPQILFVRGHQIKQGRPSKINFVIRWRGSRDRFQGIEWVPTKLPAGCRWHKTTLTPISTYGGVHSQVLSLHLLGEKTGNYRIPLRFAYKRSGHPTPLQIDKGTLFLYVKAPPAPQKPLKRKAYTPIPWK